MIRHINKRKDVFTFDHINRSEKAFDEVQHSFVIKAIYRLNAIHIKIVIQSDTCTSMFIAAVFIIAKIWKQPKCPSVKEWMWYIYTMEYIKKKNKKRRMKSCHLQ